MTAAVIQPTVVLSAIVAGLFVGVGGFVLLGLVTLGGWNPHPDTAHTWVMLWLAVSFTAALSVLGIDVFVGGLGDFLYVGLVAIGATVGYLSGAVSVGRPWLSPSGSRTG